MKKIGILVVFLSGWVLMGLYIYYDYRLYGSFILTHLFSLQEPVHQIIFHVILFLTPIMTTCISYFLIKREKVILDLEEALEKVKTLSGCLPICTSCKKIRDDKGYWKQIETYIRDHSEANFTHGLCPECAKKMIQELDRINNEQ